MKNSSRAHLKAAPTSGLKEDSRAWEVALRECRKPGVPIQSSHQLYTASSLCGRRLPWRRASVSRRSCRGRDVAWREADLHQGPFRAQEPLPSCSAGSTPSIPRTLQVWGSSTSPQTDTRGHKRVGRTTLALHHLRNKPIRVVRAANRSVHACCVRPSRAHPAWRS